MYHSIKSFIHSKNSVSLEDIKEIDNKPLPTLWLLGKTGAGKSSIIQALTHLTKIDIGNGYQPCTKASSAYLFPENNPVLRFLDTQGLSEASYDPKEDIDACAAQSHILLVVAKIDEPEQSALLNALKQIQKQSSIKHLLIIHTAVNTVSDNERVQMQAYNQAQFEKAWGSEIQNIAVDFDCETKSYYNQNALIEALSQILPIIELMLNKSEYSSKEESIFYQHQKQILWYAGSASAFDVLPAVGLVSVPAIQASMLHNLANEYQIVWNKRAFSELIGALGTSFSLQYGLKLGTRQLIKFIPIYGQTLGAVAAAALSFTTTYALGRVACYYFYHKYRDEPLSQKDLQQVYKEAFIKGKEAVFHEQNKK